jgi:hypothetical protein
MRSSAIIAVAAVLLAACDCGQHKPGTGIPDVVLDVPDDTVVDGLADLSDLPGEVPGDAAGDVVDEDAGPTMAGSPFRCETSGGGALSSESYSMDLFIGPVRPLGSLSSDNYTMKLGPAGMRGP